MLSAYRTPWWLKTPYNASKLVARFSSAHTLEVDFHIKLHDGRYLDSTECDQIRSQIYDFICIQAHPVSKGRRRRSPERERHHIITALHSLDYFILNGKAIQLAKHGLAAVAAPHVTSFLATVAKSQDIVEEIYGLKARLAAFLRKKGAALVEPVITQCCKKYPELLDFDIPQDEWRLGLTQDELLRARIYLQLNSLYKAGTDRKYLKVPHISRIINSIYENTLFGAKCLKSAGSFLELCLSPKDRYLREKPGVPVRTTYEDPRCPKIKYDEYRDKLLTWLPLSRLGIGMPPSSLSTAQTLGVKDFDFKQAGRTRAVPPPIVKVSIDKAISYFYENSAHLLESLGQVLSRSEKQGCTPYKLQNFGDWLSRGSVAFGITAWRISLDDKNRKLDTEQFLTQLRDTRSGLLEASQCLWGAMLLIIGTVLAPRQGEVSDITGSSLDPTGEWLGLLSRKTGFDGSRQEDARPIPQVATDIVKTLKTFFEKFPTLNNEFLFAVPTYYACFAKNETAVNSAIDLFLDFIESPVDAAGARYYLRFHQLRHFFATMFFYSASFSDPETLQWFLRQVDPEQVWIYISATASGKVLRQYKADVSAFLVRNGNDSLDALTQLLKATWGVQRFSVMTEEDLSSHIEDLLMNGDISLEPVFIKCGSGVIPRMGVIVWKSKNA
jgi:hypothetical protein